MAIVLPPIHFHFIIVLSVTIIGFATIQAG